MSPNPSDDVLSSLRADLDGDVIQPGDAGWDAIYG